MQSSGARDLDGLAVDAVVKDVADRWIRMGEEAVSSRALLRRLWWLCERQDVIGIKSPRGCHGVHSDP